MPIRVLYLGEEGPSNLEWAFRRSFAAAGCQVDFLDVTGAAQVERLRFLRPGTIRYRAARRILRPLLRAAVVGSLRRIARGQRYDLVFCHKTLLPPARAVKDTAIRTGAQLFCFYPDNPLDPHPTHTSRHSRALVPLTDCYFTFEPYMIEALKRAGAPRVEFLAFAHDPALHHPTPISDVERAALRSQLAFVGSCTPERVGWFRHLLDYELGLWGSGWERARGTDSRFRRAVRGPGQWGEAFCKIYAAADIAFNIVSATCLSPFQPGRAHNMRSFEALASGGFIMSNRTPELLEMFEEDREMVYFSSPEELREKVEFYLNHPEDRKRIARSGYERVRYETYDRRAQQILETLEELKQASARRPGAGTRV